MIVILSVAMPVNRVAAAVKRLHVCLAGKQPRSYRGYLFGVHTDRVQRCAPEARQNSYHRGGCVSWFVTGSEGNPACVQRRRCRRVVAFVTILSLALSLGARADTVRLLVQNGYLPQVPVLVRVEILRPDGSKNRDLWDAQATLSVDQPGVTLSTNKVTLRNGLGSALLTFGGGGDFNLAATVNGMQATKPLNSLAGLPVTTIGGTLSGASTTWSGVVRITNDVTVPPGHTLTIQSNTLVLVNGVAVGTNAPDLIVNGTILSLGTETHPVTLTSSDSGLRWGQIRHSNAPPSVYRYTTITLAGRTTGEGHTGTGPVIRPSGSRINFDHCNITDHADGSGGPGKVLYAVSGSDLVFNDCLLARARMGPEIAGTALLCTNTWIMEMRGPDDADGIYLHDQQAGQALLLSGCVIAGGDDDGIDTLGSVVTAENCILRDWANPNEDAKGISVFHGETDVRRSLIVNCLVGISAKSSGPLARVNIQNCTILGNTNGIVAAFKSNATAGNIDFRVTNSIVRAYIPVRTDFGPTNFNIGYCNLGEVWPGTGNLTADPQFLNGGPNDYHLLPGSPCIDAGDPAGPSDPDGTRADMGAFPFELSALAPVIVSVPRSQSAVVNGCATFEVGATGWLPFGYEWRHNGAPLVDRTNQMLSFCNVQPPDAGEYVVIISNPAGVVTSSPPARLTVLLPPSITRQPQSYTAIETCDAAFDIGCDERPAQSEWNGLFRRCVKRRGVRHERRRGVEHFPGRNASNDYNPATESDGGTRVERVIHRCRNVVAVP